MLSVAESCVAAISPRELNRVQSDMRHFHVAYGFGDILDLGETRFEIYSFSIL